MYLALARKYRPQTWTSVVGQEHVTTTLALAVQTGRLHHAYLFCGARGVGKTTVARILAKAVNCTARDAAGNPCNDCVHCRGITDGRSMDVQEIDGASHTSVDDVRELIEQLKYLPTSEQYKIYVIDEVHMLSRSAFNALLKTLEEPPPHILFVFATTEPHAIPATVLSRCQRYDFRRVSYAKIVDTLRGIAQAEGYQITDDVLQFLAIESEGSLRDAESLLDQTVAFAGNTVTMQPVRELLGFADQHTLRALLTAIIARDATAALAAIDTVFQAGGNLPRLAHDLLEWTRHAWVLSSCGTLPAADAVSSDDLVWLASLVAQAPLPLWQQWFALLYRGYDDIARGKFPKLILESLVLQMIQVPALDSVQELLTQVEQLLPGNPVTPKIAASAPSMVRADVAPQVVRPPMPAPSASAVHAPVAVAATLSWDGFMQWLRAERSRLAAIVDEGTLVQATPACVELSYPKDSLYGEMLVEADRRAQLQTLLQERFSPDCQLRVQFAAPTTAAPAHPAASKRQAAADQVKLNPGVQDAMRILGAEVEAVKPMPGTGS